MDYLNGNLTVKQAEELKQMLKDEGYDLSQLNELEKLVRELDEIKEPEPRQEMKDNFYHMLEEEKAKIVSKQKFIESVLNPIRSLFEPANLPKMAYASLILIIGMVLGHWIIPDKQLQSQTAMMME